MWQKMLLFLSLMTLVSTVALAAQLPLKILNRCSFATPPTGVDRFTSTATSENCPTDEGQIFYIPRDNTSGRYTLYRLYNSSWIDHMENLSQILGWTTEGILGYPFTTQITGTSGIGRLWNSSIQDHATVQCQESFPGYVSEGCGSTGLGFGYPRYFTSNTNLLSLSGGEITIKSNRVAGGATWELWWNGKQFLNYYDYGRQLQGAVFWKTSGTAPLHNPTEAGDQYATPSIPVRRRHGSPLLTASNSGLTQTTKSIPLEWEPDLWGGNSDVPILMQGWELGKSVTLNFNGMPRVMKYILNVTTDAAVSYQDCCGPHISAIAFITGDFTKYYTWSAVGNVLTDVTAVVPECTPEYVFSNWSGAGGVITTTSNSAYTIGVYGRKPINGGSADELRLGDGSGAPYCGTGTGPEDIAFSTVHAVRKAALPAGASSYTYYFTVGSLTQVRNDMVTLYNSGF